MMGFQNFEIQKVATPSASLTDVWMLLILLLMILASLKRKATRILDRSQTDQLRGLAILLIIIGHFWVHTAARQPKLILGDAGVSLFFILSGFGLTCSSWNRSTPLSSFAKKRMLRVFVPYWWSTALILVLDALFLHRTYRPSDLLLTLAGLNLTPTVDRIDFVRWFITLLILWYMLFFAVQAIPRTAIRIGLLFLAAALLFLLDYYVAHLGWYQLFSFPVGCLLALERDRIASFFEERRNTRRLLFTALTGSMAVILFKVVLQEELVQRIPSILLQGLVEAVDIIGSLSALTFIGLLARFSLASSLLIVTGGLSYELFLLHGPFLIKYNFILRVPHVVLGLFADIAFIVFIAFCFRAATGRATALIGSLYARVKRGANPHDSNDPLLCLPAAPPAAATDENPNRPGMEAFPSRDSG